LLLGCFALAALPISSLAADRVFADGFERFWKVSATDVAIASTDSTVWNSLKSRCDNDLD